MAVVAQVGENCARVCAAAAKDLAQVVARAVALLGSITQESWRDHVMEPAWPCFERTYRECLKVAPPAELIAERLEALTPYPPDDRAEGWRFAQNALRYRAADRMSCEELLRLPLFPAVPAERPWSHRPQASALPRSDAIADVTTISSQASAASLQGPASAASASGATPVSGGFQQALGSEASVLADSTPMPSLAATALAGADGAALPGSGEVVGGEKGGGGGNGVSVWNSSPVGEGAGVQR